MERTPGSLPPPMSVPLLDDHDVVHATKVLVNSVRVDTNETDAEENTAMSARAALLLPHNTEEGEDPYFTEHPEEIDSDDSIVKKFAFDVDGVVRTDFRMVVLALVVLTVTIYSFGAEGLDPLLFLVPIYLVGLALFLRFRKLQVAALHVAVTDQGVVFVQERHPTWYGRKGHRCQFLPYRMIGSVTFRDPTGDCYFGVEDTLSYIALYHYERERYSCIPDHFPILRLRGVLNAEAFHSLVAERINAHDAEDPTTGRDQDSGRVGG